MLIDVCGINWGTNASSVFFVGYIDQMDITEGPETNGMM